MSTFYPEQSIVEAERTTDGQEASTGRAPSSGGVTGVGRRGEYVRLKGSHAAGSSDLAISPIVSQRTTPSTVPERRASPEKRLSAASVSMPAKKHQVAGDGFFRIGLRTASAAARMAATKGSVEKVPAIIVGWFFRDGAMRRAASSILREMDRQWRGSRSWSNSCRLSHHKGQGARSERAKNTGRPRRLDAPGIMSGDMDREEAES